MARVVGHRAPPPDRHDPVSRCTRCRRVRLLGCGNEFAAEPSEWADLNSGAQPNLSRHFLEHHSASADSCQSLACLLDIGQSR